MLRSWWSLRAVGMLPLLLALCVQAAVTPRSLPIAFEANRGQIAPDAAYHLHRDSVDAFFVRDGVDLKLGGVTRSEDTLRLRFLHGTAEPQGKGKLAGHANYLIGSDSSRWVQNVPLYSEIDYANLYPGIALSFYGNEKELEHDFQVAPGADPAQIAFQVDNSTGLEVLANGNLRVSSRYGALTLEKPVAYQVGSGHHDPVIADFVVGSDKMVRFKIGSYDRDRPLVIDPVLIFATYLGGTGTDTIQAATTDASGNVLVVGTTGSTDFPVKNPEQGTCGSSQCQSTFVPKLDPEG